MYIDEHRTIVMEQSEWPGSIGDSCAESSRYNHMVLHNDLGLGVIRPMNLDKFVTRTGYIRHPSAPEGWRESDMSSDQALPFYIAVDSHLKRQMRDRIQNAGWRTGNGDLVNVTFYAVLSDNKVLLTFSLITQAAIFKFPFRWSDSKKTFERTTNNSGDYLNYLHAATYIPRWARLVSAETLKRKVREYYSVEKNSEWLIEIYDRFIDTEFT